ncbi:MAG: nuclear transport factor 2 family protein [Chthoniobacterales bacterium]
MKPHFLVAAVVVPFLHLSILVAAPDNAATVHPEISAIIGEIRSVLDAQVAAWNRGDIDGFMNGYARSSETEFVSGDTITRGWQTVRDRYTRKYDSREKMGALAFSEIEIKPLSAEAAVVTGRWELTRREDKPNGRFTLIFRKFPEGWRIVHDHTIVVRRINREARIPGRK